MDTKVASSTARRLSIGLALIGLGSALIYAMALLRFPLLRIYARPLQNLDKLTDSQPLAGLALAGLILALFLSYGLGWQCVARLSRSSSRLTLLVLVGCSLGFIGLLLLVYPISSIDLYDYLFRGRMLVRYGANPYIHSPIDFADDPLFGYVAWRRAVSAYGPLWEGLSWITARLAGEAPGAPAPPDTAALLRLMLGYKLLSAVGFLLSGAAIWAVLGRTAPQWRLPGLYLWLWNPLALWESIAAGHNDSWMALMIILAIGVMGRATAPGGGTRRSIGAFLALTVGGLIKFLALFLGPLLLGAALRRQPNLAARLRLIILGGLSCALLVGVAYAPFWDGWSTLQNVSNRGTLFTASWLAAFQSELYALTKTDLAQPIATALGMGLLIFGVAWTSWWAWSEPDDLAAPAVWLLLWFLFLCNPWFQPWYLLWALALVALQPWRGRLVLGMGVFCCTALLSYLAGSFLLPALSWKVDSAAWNLLVSLLIYGPALLVLGWRQIAGSAAWLRGLAQQRARAPQGPDAAVN